MTWQVLVPGPASAASEDAEPDSARDLPSARTLAIVPRASSQALPPFARSSKAGTHRLSPISQPTLADLFSAVRSLETCARTRTVNQHGTSRWQRGSANGSAPASRKHLGRSHKGIAELQSAVRTQGNALADLQEILTQASGDVRHLRLSVARALQVMGARVASD